MFSALTNSWAFARLLRLKTQAANSLLRRKTSRALILLTPRDVLKIDNLGVLAAESALLEHLDTVRLDLDVFKPTRTFVLEQQRVVVHTRHSRGVR